MSSELIISWVVTAVVFGAFTSGLAGSKGHDEASWFFGGLVFGPLALLVCLGLPDLKLRKYIRCIAERHGALSSPPSSASDWEKGSEGWGPDAEPLTPTPPSSDVDVEAQRRQILGLK